MENTVKPTLLAESGRSSIARAAPKTNSPAAEFTRDQFQGVQRIKASHDHYEILSVSNTSTDAELKKAYRKLALQFHPDKNKAPGSVEAFKAINNAFAVLSDHDKRKQYDEGKMHDSTTDNDFENDEFPGFDFDDISAKKFTMFFGYVFPGSKFHNQQRQREYNCNAENVNLGHAMMLVLKVLVLIFLIVVTFITSLVFIKDPVYSLGWSHDYNTKKLTADLGVPYFVKESFMTDYSGNLKILEVHIEDDYIGNLRNECSKQNKYKEHMLWRAKRYEDEVLQKQAEDWNIPSCGALKELRKKYT